MMIFERFGFLFALHEPTGLSFVQLWYFRSKGDFNWKWIRIVLFVAGYTFPYWGIMQEKTRRGPADTRQSSYLLAGSSTELYNMVLNSLGPNVSLVVGLVVGRNVVLKNNEISASFDWDMTAWWEDVWLDWSFFMKYIVVHAILHLLFVSPLNDWLWRMCLRFGMYSAWSFFVY